MQSLIFKGVCDAIQDEKKGLIFPARIALNQSSVLVNGRNISLTAGMSLNAEIKTGQRRIIEYFLGPLMAYRQETLKER